MRDWDNFTKLVELSHKMGEMGGPNFNARKGLGKVTFRSHALHGNILKDALHSGPQARFSLHSHAARGNDEKIHSV
jgi:hypothetical protein